MPCQGSKAAKPLNNGSKGMSGSMGGGGGGGQSALHMDVKTLDPSAADSKETSPKGASAKVMNASNDCGGIEIKLVEVLKKKKKKKKEEGREWNSKRKLYYHYIRTDCLSSF